MVNSSEGVACRVKQRMIDTAAGNPPHARPLLLFPEGTTTNGVFMLPFKTGAFLAGVPLQPVIIQYHTNRVSPSWEAIPIKQHIFLLFCDPIHSVTCYELPVYVPSPEEIADPRLYADNVRRKMVSGLQDLFKKEIKRIRARSAGFHCNVCFHDLDLVLYCSFADAIFWFERY